LGTLRIKIIVPHSSYIETMEEPFLHLRYRMNLRHEIQCVLEREMHKFILPANTNPDMYVMSVINLYVKNAITCPLAHSPEYSQYHKPQYISTRPHEIGEIELRSGSQSTKLPG